MKSRVRKKPSKKIETEALVPKPPRKGKGGAPKGSQNHLIHGHHPRYDVLSQMGFDQFIDKFDKRTLAGKHFLNRREQTYIDAGGKESLSQNQLTIVDHKMAIDTLIDSGLAWILQYEAGPVNRRNGKYRPIVQEIQRLVETSTKLAQALGLTRKEKPVPSIQDWMNSKESEEGE
jgi:hypothetical protein